MTVSHFDFDRFVGVCEAAVVGCLFDEFATVDDDEGFVAIFVARGDSADQLCEDDLVEAIVSKCLLPGRKYELPSSQHPSQEISPTACAPRPHISKPTVYILPGNHGGLYLTVPAL